MGKQQKPQQFLLHSAEEFGEARKLEIREVIAYTLISILKGIGAGMCGIVAMGVYLAWRGEDFGLLDVAVGFAIAGFPTVGLQLIAGDLNALVDGVRSYRAVQTMTPPTMPPQPEAPAPGILVRPYKGEPYIARREGPVLQTPKPLQLTPPVAAAAIQASLERNGQWSRQIITGAWVGDRTIPRRIFERLTAILAHQGFLQPRPGGGHQLAPGITSYEAARQYIPALPQRPGTRPGLPAPSPACLPACPPARPPARTAANRRRDLFLECGCDVALYLKRRKELK